MTHRTKSGFKYEFEDGNSFGLEAFADDSALE